MKSKTSAPASDNGAVWSGGELDPIGRGGVFPNAINDHAFVAGTTKPSSFDFDAFLCQFRAGACSGGLFDLGGLGGTSSFGNDINRTGMVVGASDLPGDSARHASVCNNPTCTGGMRDLGTLGGDASLAEGVNDARLARRRGGDGSAALSTPSHAPTDRAPARAPAGWTTSARWAAPRAPRRGQRQRGRRRRLADHRQRGSPRLPRRRRHARPAVPAGGHEQLRLRGQRRRARGREHQ